MDYDGDGVKNSRDVCPYNKLISKTNFQDYFIVKLDPEGTSQIDPVWLFSDQVWQEKIASVKFVKTFPYISCLYYIGC